MSASYDSSNIFAKILRQEIPCQKILETDHILAFYDVNPKAKIHALVIPKGAYVSSFDFHAKASDADITGYYRGLSDVIKELGLTYDEKGNQGYRLISNCGFHGGQEVSHFHTHILGGEKLSSF